MNIETCLLVKYKYLSNANHKIHFKMITVYHEKSFASIRVGLRWGGVTKKYGNPQAYFYFTNRGEGEGEGTRKSLQLVTTP